MIRECVKNRLSTTAPSSGPVAGWLIAGGELAEAVRGSAAGAWVVLLSMSGVRRAGDRC